MSSVQMLFVSLKRTVSRLDLTGGKAQEHHIGLGMKFQVTGPLYEKACFPYLLSLRHETSICGMQRAGRVTDSEKIRQVGRKR